MERAETAFIKLLIKAFPLTFQVKEAYYASDISVIVNRSSQFNVFSTDNRVRNIHT